MPDSLNDVLMQRVAEPKPLKAPGDRLPTPWVDDDEWLWQLRQELLPDLHQSMPRILIRTTPSGTASRSNGQLAFTAPNDPHIYVNAFTDTYQKARSGDDTARKELAGLLAHEYRHIYGDDEPTAYQYQADRLKELDAPSSTIDKVMKALHHTQQRQTNGR